jgi:GNAT superfamily N-acetyltransferase
MRIRELVREEIDDLWSIDRAEWIDEVYHHEGGRLVLKREHYDVKGWPPGEPERDLPILLDCFEHGGSFYGAFEDETLVGVAVLESRFIGRANDQLQLKFLHVSREYRGAGLGRTLFERAVARAKALGARRLYVSASPSKNTIRFYFARGCEVTDELDSKLFELEPEDIHLEYELPS